LIIDRFHSHSYFYKVEYGIDKETMICCEFWHSNDFDYVGNILNFHTLDNIVTNMTSLKFCVLHMKDDIVIKDKKLKFLLHIRMKYRDDKEVELIEFGDRL